MSEGGRWSFMPRQPGSKLREPTAGAFFSSDATGGAGAALVREGIQNSLDAKASSDAVLVRISFRLGEHAPLWQDIAPWLRDAVDHYRAVPRNGIHPDDLPEFADGERCNLLVFEDFETTGLGGDPEAAFPEEDPGEKQRNHFFHFWRAEGRSEKKKDELGSWGLGKDVYYRASRINTAFGLTIRPGANSKRALLMGQSILKLHTISTDKHEARYQEGYWGAPNLGPTGVVLPVENTTAVGSFRTTFGLWRGDDPGLSVVVPYLDVEIKRDEVSRAIVQNYFYAILANQLEVVVRLPGEQDEYTMDSQSLPEVAQDLQQAGKVTPVDTAAIDLASWALGDLQAKNRHELPAPANTNSSSNWQHQEFGDFLETLKETLTRKAKIAVRVPVNVRHRKKGSGVSHFDVYIQPADNNELYKPTFIRDGIVIPDVRTRGVRGIHSLVIVESGPLAEFLRQSENPSHTTWQREEVRKDYVNAPSTLDFVTMSVRRIMDRLAASDQARDDTLLTDLFPVADPAQPTPKTPRPKNEGEPPDRRPRPPKMTLKKRPGGFRLETGPGFTEGKQRWVVKAAYDVRRGNPLTQYQPADFQLDRAPIAVTSAGVDRIDIAPGGHKNRIVIDDPVPGEFWLEVNGFDQNRQLLIRVEKRAASA